MKSHQKVVGFKYVGRNDGSRNGFIKYYKLYASYDSDDFVEDEVVSAGRFHSGTPRIIMLPGPGYRDQD